MHIFHAVFIKMHTCIIDCVCSCTLKSSHLFCCMFLFICVCILTKDNVFKINSKNKKKFLPNYLLYMFLSCYQQRNYFFYLDYVKFSFFFKTIFKVFIDVLSLQNILAQEILMHIYRQKIFHERNVRLQLNLVKYLIQIA